MIWSKLIRWAGVTVVSVAIPAAAMAHTHRHVSLTKPVTASAKVSTTHKLTATKTAAKHLVSKSHKKTSLISHKLVAKKLTSKKHTPSKLSHVTVKHTTLTSKPKIASKTVKPSM